MSSEASAEARALLQSAMRLHERDAIDAAIAEAEAAVLDSPGFCEAHAYLGNTLVTRRRRFADGLVALERAAALCPEDAAILYTLGWCREFVANALEKRRGHHQAVAEDAPTLYRSASEVLLAARALEPEPGLLGDIEDILDVIAAATGEPWEEDA